MRKIFYKCLTCGFLYPKEEIKDGKCYLCMEEEITIFKKIKELLKK